MLEGIVRESIGAKSAKALRKDGYLIANIYAKGVENIHAAFKMNEFIKTVKSKDSLKFPINVGGKNYDVVVVEYQKHPVTKILKHVDLKIVLDDVESKYMVPAIPVGTPKGLKNKGVYLQPRKRIAVRCTGKNLPDSIEMDVASLDVEDNILVRDLKVPANVTILDADRYLVAAVVKAK